MSSGYCLIIGHAQDRPLRLGMYRPMDKTAESPSTELVSSVADRREAPLRSLIDDSTTQADGAIERVLDLEANGLLTVSSFNASI